MTPHRAGRQAAWLILALASLIAGCQRTSPAPATAPDRTDPVWSEHLAEHSAGALPRAAPLRLRFSHDVVAPEKVGQSAADVLKVEPGLDGAPRYAGPREIVWEHAAPLKADQEYRARPLKANA